MRTSELVVFSVEALVEFVFWYSKIKSPRPCTLQFLALLTWGGLQADSPVRAGSAATRMRTLPIREHRVLCLLECATKPEVEFCFLSWARSSAQNLCWTQPPLCRPSTPQRPHTPETAGTDLKNRVPVWEVTWSIAYARLWRDLGWMVFESKSLHFVYDVSEQVQNAGMSSYCNFLWLTIWVVRRH